MTPKKPVPARLWAYLARDASIGVILRRGPKDWMQMIHWDTKNDVFTPGQWMKGHFWKQRSGLSPDGQLFIYAVALPYKKIHNPDHPPNPEYGIGWTAVSKPPYFTALALWPHDTNGGFFVDNRTVYVTSEVTHPNHEPQGLKFILNAVDSDWFQINGWIKLRDPHRMSHIKDNHAYLSISKIETWRKDVDSFNFSLIAKTAREDIQLGGTPPGKRSGDNQQYAVIDRRTNQEATLKDVVWADFDQQKRLVLAKHGKLFSAAVVDGELSYTELADFNANQPEAIESPDWAKKW
jgi:hypothetical protein